MALVPSFVVDKVCAVGEFEELGDRFGLHVPAVGDYVRLTALYPRSIAGLSGRVLLVDAGGEVLVELDGGRQVWMRARDLAIVIEGDR